MEKLSADRDSSKLGFLRIVFCFFLSFIQIFSQLGCRDVDLGVQPNNRIPGLMGIHSVVFLILENTNFETAKKQNALKEIAGLGAVLGNYYALTHPSQPNYIAMVSGGMHGVTTNQPARIDVPHVGELLQKYKRDWAVYAEDFPGDCFLGEVFGDYSRRHVPFLSFKNVQDDKAQCGKIKGADQFEVDLAAGVLPELVLYIPNNRNNGHDTGVKFADNWLGTHWNETRRKMLLSQKVLWVITFDEDAGAKNQVYTAVIGDSVKPGFVSLQRYDHYSLLRTVEHIFSLPTLGQEDANATLIDDIWKN